MQHLYHIISCQWLLIPSGADTHTYTHTHTHTHTRTHTHKHTNTETKAILRNQAYTSFTNEDTPLNSTSLIKGLFHYSAFMYSLKLQFLSSSKSVIQQKFIAILYSNCIRSCCRNCNQ